MSLPPGWKIKRELLRFWRDIKSAPRKSAWYLFSTFYYDRFLSRQRQTWTGSQDMASKVAVMVIYPSDGFLESHALTLQHLQDNGYSTVVVSNLPVPTEDRSRILSLCMRYIERPNFGYDFGGYRDGVLSIADALPDLNRLVLMNDSAWYPLPETSNWLQEAEDLSVDFAGAVSNYGTPRCAPETFRTLKWSYSSDHRNFHYCSFALSVGPNILKSRKFRQFWSKFRLDNDKKRVVRRGEIGLTQWVLKNQFTHDTTCRPQALEGVLENLSDARLRQVVKRTIFPEHPRGEAEKQPVLDIPDDHPDWRHTATRFVLMAASQQGVSYALPELTTKEMAFPFLKKSPLRLSKSGSDITLDIISEIPDRTGTIIQQEADMLLAKRKPQPSPRPGGRQP